MIKLGIVGYGNLGRGVELAISQNADMQLVAVFTRRNPASIKSGVPVLPIERVSEFRNKIDVMVLCGGSASDLPQQGPEMAAMFNTVDSFDTHAKIPEYYEKMNRIANENGHLSLISVGWDPGLFSMIRALGESVLPQGVSYTFWGKGVSQGHSDAIRRIKGVKDARQYTIPNESAVIQARTGEQPKLNDAQKHTRECYVVAEADGDRQEIERQIVTMPNYFAGYQTSVHFISADELARHHSKMPHGGLVLRTGTTSSENTHKMEFGLKLDSNPEFTSSVVVAFARAVARLAREGQTGARTALDIPLAYLSPKSAAELRKTLI